MKSTQLEVYAKKFNAMAKRERLILLLAVLAIIYLIWSLVFLAPVSEKIESLQAQKQTLDRRYTDLQAQQQLFGQAATQDPNAGKKRQIDRLRETLQSLDETLQALSVGLVPAELLPQVLHDVLSNKGNLQLLGMQTLPVEKLAISESGTTPSLNGDFEETPQQVDVYRHAVELKMRGQYFAVMDYLQSLEGLQWRFYWDTLDYQVEGYPYAITTLEVYTLSAGEGLLGE